MQRVFSFCIAVLLLPFLMVISCDQNSTTPGGETPTPPEETPVYPTVTLTEGEVTDESVSFTITPEYATSVRYSVYVSGEELPTAEELLTPGTDFSGKPADATVADEYVVDGLSAGTDYVIIAAAMNEDGYSDVAQINMTTTIPEMSLELSFVESTATEVVFHIDSENVSEVAAIVLEEGTQVPEAEYIFENGTLLDEVSGDFTVNGLEPLTTYVIVAAAKDVAGKNMMASEAIEVTTALPDMAPPVVGDYYYSDGTWSSELDPAKTPIGIVFYAGVASEMGDNSAYYKNKAGEPMTDFHGYVVALKDAQNSKGVWWSFYDSWAEPTGVSTEVDDFLGYTNTLAIKSHANKLGVGFSDSNTSYPAAYLASDGYEAECPSPEMSTGWFLPAAGQLQYIWDQVYFNPSGNLIAWLEDSFESLGDMAEQMYTRDSEYWSSTEQVDSFATTVRAYYVCYDSSNFKPGFTAWYNKNTEFRVRAILAF